MSDIDINRVLQNIGELQNQNAIDFQHWNLLDQEIEKIKEDIDVRQRNLNILIKKINSDIETLKEKVNNLSQNL
ncbi:MAG: hypothetical protein MSS77_02990 [Mollicutes bacterium]|nr:hypothetical protein [Mollicutes bacterium]